MAGVTAMEAGNRIIEENIIQTDKKNIEMEDLELTKEWDKIFPKSYKVNHSKVTFRNRYGITLAADMYTPKNINGKMAAIAISGPFGAVKEQASGLYAQTMAERGFLTIAFDPSYTGESGGTPRYVASPDIKTEDFCAAVDFSLHTMTSIPNASASSVFADGEVWHSTLPRSIPASRPQSLPRCTT